ncbi:MAG: alpha-amylase family glycosyl hydrolase [Ktedonobacteraceae bacterium]
MPADLLTRKKANFVLWRPGRNDILPTLFIGNFQAPGSFTNFREIPLQQVQGFPDLWQIAANTCGLADGQVYFYWFKALDTIPGHVRNIFYCTDPIAFTVDRRFAAPPPADSDGLPSGEPASVILYQNGVLIPCDPEGQTVDFADDVALAELPVNSKLVIYELPTRWSHRVQQGGIEVGNGTFQDVLALLVPAQTAPNFPGVNALEGRAHLLDLGITALELLPPEDSDQFLEWGYGTANFFAADFDLGRPDGQATPTASVDLATLIKTCHRTHIRFFLDAVMAFARDNSEIIINYPDFYVRPGDEQGRQDFGGTLFEYDFPPQDAPTGYDPISGRLAQTLIPARQYMLAYITRWMEYYRIDGIRVDSVNNIKNYDFVGAFKDWARSLWRQRGGSDDRFLVVGEELAVPQDLLTQKRLDGLWNENFKRILRQVILGRNASNIGESSFEWSVRKLIDCRNLGFTDGAQAVNYIGSHDVGGFQNERFYNYLQNNGILEKEKYFKLAFVCLLTAVGVPMILAGDEFADKQDLELSNADDPRKQIDPVNYDRLADPWRKNVFDYVSRLIRLRTTSPALAVNDTDFIHVDFTEGKRVLVWKRGQGDRVVIMVANFSDYGSPGGIDGEYVVPNWPELDQGWYEVTQQRQVAANKVGREPVFSWEAKVYTPLFMPH